MAARSWRFYTGRLLLAGAAIGLAGWLAGYPISSLVAAALIYLGWQVLNLFRLLQWTLDTDREIPESHGLWADIFDRINTLQKHSRSEKERYRAMIDELRVLTDAFPDATLVIDEDDNITWFNRAAVEILGLRNPDDLGQPVTNLIRGQVFANWLAVQSSVKSPLEMTSPRDDSCWLMANAAAIGQRQRLIVLRDITRVHNLEQARRDVVANISHELRTPLTVLRGYLELLENHPSDDVNGSAKRMLGQALQMQTLLDDLLELSRLQDDVLRGEEELVNVPTLLMQLKEQAEELSRGDHDLVFEVDPQLFLTGSSADLESAFSNLITNAIKYTPKGGTISVLWKTGRRGPRMTVRDTGIGIPRRDIPRLTERFYRVGSDRARETGGTGLGLAIVKHVLNAHQAELSIRSELGEGSEFTCIFPEKRAMQGNTGCNETVTIRS